MSILDQKASEISATLAPSHGLEASQASPFLDFLKELMTQLLPLLINCIPKAQRNAANVTKAMNSPNLRQRLGLRWQIRKNIDDPRTGNLGIGEIEDAFYKMGAACTEADATAMMAEVA